MGFKLPGYPDEALELALDPWSVVLLFIGLYWMSVSISDI